MTKLKALWFVAIPLAIGACTAQWQMSKVPSIWEQACADMAAAYEIETCDYAAPEVIRESYLATALEVFGIYTWQDNRIYLATSEFIRMWGEEPHRVEYHESIHAIMRHDGITTDRCESEELARVYTDQKFGTNSADNGWEVVYGCVKATP